MYLAGILVKKSAIVTTVATAMVMARQPGEDGRDDGQTTIRSTLRATTFSHRPKARPSILSDDMLLAFQRGLSVLTTVLLQTSSPSCLFQRLPVALPSLGQGRTRFQSVVSTHVQIFSPPKPAMTTNHPPTREELRRLRLAALENNSENIERAHPNPPCLFAKPKPEAVVDLMESSDEEEKHPPDGTSRKRPASSPAVKKAAKKPSKDDDLWESSDEEKEVPRKKPPPPRKKAQLKVSSTIQAAAKPAALIQGTETSFQLATYNLWFGPHRDGNPYPEARMNAIAELLLARTDPPLYFCAFQEVVHSLDDALFPLLESMGYKVIRQPLDNPIFLPYGVALAVHPQLTILDCGWKPYRMTQQERGFCYARCRLPNNSVCLVTSTHLESFMGKEISVKAARAQQLSVMEKFCNDQLDQQRADLAIMMGDLNWDDASRKPADDPLESVLSSVEWKDAWKATNHLRSTTDSRKGYSYDAKLNPMLGGGIRRRFDRCLVRTTRRALVNFISTDLLGTQAIPGLFHNYQNQYTRAVTNRATAPSDHFCLVTHLQTFNSAN